MPQITHCALCEVEITAANDSPEHILAQSIGGRRSVRRFLCERCNRETGQKWDAIAAKQLNFLCLLFGIKRQDRQVPTGEFDTVSGQAIRIHADGQMSLPNTRPTVTTSGSTVQIQARTHTVEQARQMLQGMKRHYANLDIDAGMENVTEERTYLTEPLTATLNFGGAQSGRSVVKSAVALAVASGIDAKSCDEALGCLKTEDQQPCFGYFYSRDLVKNRPTDKVFHCVAIRADSSSQKLIGYVELFSLYRMIVCLSRKYTGASLSNYYAIDPTSGQELELDLDLSLSEEEFRRASANEEDYARNIERVYGEVFAIGQSGAFDRERKRVIERAWKECLGELSFPPDHTLTSEDADALSKCLAKRMESFLMHFLSNRRNARH